MSVFSRYIFGGSGYIFSALSRGRIAGAFPRTCAPQVLDNPARGNYFFIFNV